MHNRNRKPRANPQTLFAFWVYDSYPHMLGGVVDETKRHSRAAEFAPDDQPVFIPSYGHWFRPFALIRGAEGAQLLADVEALRAQRREAEAKLREEFRGKLRERLTRAGVTHPTLDKP